jgi:predicted metalloprotease
MRQLQQGKSKAEANKLSVALEPTSRFLWVYGRITTKMNDILEDGDLDEALSAAHVGDDAIQSKMQGTLYLNHSLMEPLNNANIGL